MVEWAVLDAVARGDAQTVSDVAHALGIREAEAARLVREAELEGLLTLADDRTSLTHGGGAVMLTAYGRKRWDRLDA